MKLIQINAWMGKLSPTLLRFLRKENPDFICVQEIFNSEKDVPVPNRQFNLGPEIRDLFNADKTPPYYTYFSPRLSIEVAGDEKFFGNMIFSRLPFESTENFITFGQPTFLASHESSNANFAIGLQVAKIKVGDKSMILANHHGYWVGGENGKMGDDKSVESMEKVAAKMRKFASEPIILAGDLNVVAESPAMRPFDNFLTDLTATHNIKNTLSGLKYDKPVPCDHILVNDKILVKSFKVHNVIVSDHFPLAMEFDLIP